jgi:hypothetical protein
LQAISVLEEILPNLQTTHPHRAAIALRALAGDYFKVQRRILRLTEPPCR